MSQKRLVPLILVPIILTREALYSRGFRVLFSKHIKQLLIELSTPACRQAGLCLSTISFCIMDSFHEISHSFSRYLIVFALHSSTLAYYINPF